jgi:hypothetical protein
MDATGLTRKQLDALSFKLAPMLAYLQRLEARMQQRHFPASDPLLTSTREAIERMQRVMEVVHTLAVTMNEPGYFVGYEYRRDQRERRNE